MRFEILNVEHWFAAYAVASDGSVLLFDCGHSPTCQPLEYLSAQGIQTIRRLFITNYDEDHIADLPSVRQRLSIEVLTRKHEPYVHATSQPEATSDQRGDEGSP